MTKTRGALSEIKRVAGIPTTRSSKSNHTIIKTRWRKSVSLYAPNLSSLDPWRFDLTAPDV
jgi:hypothetical protein